MSRSFTHARCASLSRASRSGPPDVLLCAMTSWYVALRSASFATIERFRQVRWSAAVGESHGSPVEAEAVLSVWRGVVLFVVSAVRTRVVGVDEVKTLAGCTV